MQILPVLDLLKGQVVRGIGGRRDEYRPLVSRLTPSSAPLDVAQALRSHFGFTELYLADLDAILGQPPACTIYEDLYQAGFQLWVDAGIRVASDAESFQATHVQTLVAGLETLAGPRVLTDLLTKYGSERILFSLDLQAGRVLGNPELWISSNPEEIAGQAYELGVRRLLVLDLASVGVGKGTGTLALCRKLSQTYPQMHFAAGGGIAGMEDVHELASNGVGTALIASALHDGRITAV